ncbi:hypothetical protein [Microcoleus sp. FACHB-672]|uniref:hypothetical protein n=1 Tax=Microcoleus sp. FACHB-672 TaxID=2692825 RepID=UPI001686748F|nr:hypothetical protein [Microcoleus sp. FACHB-672]MBD2039237.1 hypothetical protein [Microcoleus sp. FACHB-672]
MQNSSHFDWMIKTNFPEADFWLINKGSLESLGQPIKEFQPYYTGLKCPALILPDYGYYLCLYFHSIGVWRRLGVGSTNLTNLRISDVKDVFKDISRQHREAKQHIQLR